MPQANAYALIGNRIFRTNGCCESFDSKLRGELLNGEIFSTLREAEILIEGWRRHYNTARPHRSLG